jgi:glycosyltransferase involved in cell wall biosynthesis
VGAGMKRLLLVADQPGWIFDRHCHEIQKRIDKYHIDIAYRRQGIRSLSKKYDLVYVLDPIPLRGGYPPQNKTIMGLRCEFLYLDHPDGPKGLYENGFPGRCVSIKDKCCIFHVLNNSQINAFKDIVTDKPLLKVRHGVNTDIFDINKNKNAFLPSDGPLKVSVSGRSSGNKGFDLVKKACKETGSKIIAAEYNRKLPVEEMPEFYSKAHIHVCMSKNEGLNNPILEAGAMGLAPISTLSGASMEMITTEKTGMLIERTVPGLVRAINIMKDDETRIYMAKSFHNEITSRWTWDVLIKEYEEMFDLYFEVVK